MKAFRLLIAWNIGLLAWVARAEDDVYLAPERFLEETFVEAAGVPAPQLVWLTKEAREQVRSILGHDYPSMRIRYWSAGARTAWILEEVGKTKPITMGLVVAGGRLERIKVLIYRESHGWEVKYPFFTDQFNGIGLDASGRLSRPIDGISGATLSVNALTKLGRLALFLDAFVRKAQAP
ncbi:MAG: FMN-binding protein [Opitutus sp.]|nr:FMN-binding protein [Opitutus sp.]MCS6247993.1 FMN-binding protein [Opitutus sp.]MCS6274547.1 FMN-binding protein [Opitutus sp.]MCS6299850.1 FMN-binding protein [Opitutus sp.]